MDANYMRNRKSQSLFPVRRSLNSGTAYHNVRGNKNRIFVINNSAKTGTNKNKGLIYALACLSSSIFFIGGIFAFYVLTLSQSSSEDTQMLDPSVVALRGGGGYDFENRRNGIINPYKNRIKENKEKNKEKNKQLDTISQDKETNEIQQKDEHEQPILSANNEIQKEDNALEEEEVTINEKDYFYATSSLKSAHWGEEGVASSWAELPFPIDCHQNSNNQLIPVTPFILSTWIFLKERSNSHQPRTVFTSKQESCPSKPATAGIKLSIVQDDYKRFLVLEFGNRLVDDADCVVIETKDHHPPIPIDAWLHLGVAISYTKQHYGNDEDSSMVLTIKLYINGSLVKQYQQEQSFKLAQTKLALSKSTITKLGTNYNNENSLEGHIAQFALWLGTTSIDKSTDLMIRSIARAGIGEDDATFVTEKMGVGKSPSFLYGMKQTDHNALESVLKEWKQGQHGTVYRGLVMNHYIPPEENRYTNYKDGSNVYKPNPMEQKQSDAVSRIRRIYIQRAMKRTWNAYEKYALGKDEFLPIQKEGLNKNGGIATLLLNSLDTLYIMKLHSEFTKATKWLETNLDMTTVAGVVSTYETTIRNLAGLLSCYDLSNDVLFLKMAEELGLRLLSAFESPSGLPYAQTTLNTGRSFNIGSMHGNVVLSEVGGLQMEFRYLAKAINKPIYAKKANKVYDVLAKIGTPDDRNLYPTYLRNEVDPPTFGNDIISLSSDSFYSNLLKVYIQGGRYEHKYKRMYDRVVNGITSTLIQKSKNGLMYVAEMHHGKIVHNMDVSTCFLPGMLALGVHVTNSTGVVNENAERDMRNAKALAYTCYQMYARMKSGLAAESVSFDNHHPSQDFEIVQNAAFHLMRPQFIESLFVLYQITHDPIYREWGWEIFQSIETYCRTDVAYASLKHVDFLGFENRLESWFSGATLKYFYLLMDPDSDIDILDKHVLNAEGHVFKVLPNVQEIKWGV